MICESSAEEVISLLVEVVRTGIIFLAAVLNVLLQKFSEDADILAELVHLQEQPRETRTEPTIDCVRRAVWGMLYADDA